MLTIYRDKTGSVRGSNAPKLPDDVIWLDLLNPTGDEKNCVEKRTGLRVPTLLLSGELSPYLTQRIVVRLADLIDGAQVRHLPAAGHMLPMTHASTINPEIVRHIARADKLAELTLAAGAPRAVVASLARE